ncbi:MAG TPA: IS481 family transposase [Polyangiaceae bacterium]|nr:IS481 family transposase [Polyangiaceae bacterium]
MSDEPPTPARLRWARLRYSIISQLLESPPEPGELAGRIAELAARRWRHPTSGEMLRLSAKTIERMYYAARNAADPIGALERKVPKHAGTHPAISPAVAAALAKQHKEHPRWSYQLHHDNLVALAKEDASIGAAPGYATVRRHMQDTGLLRQRHRRRGKREGEPIAPRETRSYEVGHVHALWHSDFHEARRSVVTASGERRNPVLFGCLDDRSRLCCHAQWYLEENTENFIHGLIQGILKRGVPRALLTDGGGAMDAAESREGLERLGIHHYVTLPYSPEQNGKQENFWAHVEGRLMAMLEGEPELSLELLNTATQAWVEQEYHRKVHTEIGETPLARLLSGPHVGRPSPEAAALRRAFRMEVTRKQRLSDGTVTVEGVRFEVPSAYGALVRLRLRVARWDLSSVELVDPRKGTYLATLYPIDKTKNADRMRRVTAPSEPGAPPPAPPGIAPLLRELMAEYAATGLPPGYLTKREEPDEGEEDSR